MAQNTDIVTALVNNGKTLGQIQQTLTAINTSLAAAFPPSKNSSKAWTPGAVGSGAQVTTTITVTGCAIEDYVQASVSVDLQGQILTGYVSSANTVTVVLFNNTGGPITLGSITLAVRTFTH